MYVHTAHSIIIIIHYHSQLGRILLINQSIFWHFVLDGPGWCYHCIGKMNDDRCFHSTGISRITIIIIDRTYKGKRKFSAKLSMQLCFDFWLKIIQNHFHCSCPRKRHECHTIFFLFFMVFLWKSEIFCSCKKKLLYNYQGFFFFLNIFNNKNYRICFHFPMWRKKQFYLHLGLKSSPIYINCIEREPFLHCVNLCEIWKEEGGGDRYTTMF